MSKRCPTTNKICYDSRYLADKMREKMEFKKLVSFRCYLCPECNSWHVTHKFNKRRVEMVLLDIGLKGISNGC